MPRSPTTRWPATIRWTRPRSTGRSSRRRRSCARICAGLRIGIVRGVRYRRARRRDRRGLRRRRIAISKRSAPSWSKSSCRPPSYGLATYYLIAPAECSSNLARFDGVRYGLRVEGADVARDVRAHARRGLRPRGQAPHPDRHLRALERLLRRLLRPRAEGAHADRATISRRAFAQCDLIACPAASSPAFQFNAKSDPYSMYLMDYYTIPMSLAGLPALSVPCGWVDARRRRRARCRWACSSARRSSPNAAARRRARLRTSDAARARTQASG